MLALANLRTGVGLNPHDFYVAEPGSDFVDGFDSIQTNPELVLAFPGRNIFVSGGIDIRIPPERDWGDFIQGFSSFLDREKLALRFDIEAQDLVGQRVGDFLARLACPGKSTLGSAPPAGQDLLKF